MTRRAFATQPGQRITPDLDVRRWSCTLRVLCLTALMWAAASWSHAAELRPSWQCLDDETVAVLRIPQPRQAFDTLRTRTKLGSVVLQHERLEKLQQFVRKASDGGVEKFEQRLAEFQLKLDDLPELLSGEAGLALLISPRQKQDDDPLVVLLAWLEPGEDVATRLFAAIGKAEEATKDESHPIQRVDLELADHPVMLLKAPRTEFEDPASVDSTPPAGKMTPAERKAWDEQRRAQLAKAKKIQTGQQNVFVCRLGGRLLMATTFAEPGALEPDVKADFDALTNVEQATGVFARFLAAHASTEAKGVQRWLETPGLRAALPEGVGVYELLVNPASLWKLAIDAAPEDVLKTLKSLGLDQVGPLAMRSALVDEQLHIGSFASLPAPRKGLLALVDQQPLPNEPPEWVSNNVVSYSHVSFDLVQLYKTAKQISSAQLGDRARQGFAALEAQFQLFLQTDPETLLGSLGTKHMMLSLVPKLAAGNGDAKLGDPHANLNLHGAAEQRVAMVWELKDEALWKKVLQAVGPLVGAKTVEEQGFEGLRSTGTLAAGAFVGRGHLVIGLGSDVIEGTLNSLRNPPQGEASLRGSAVFRRAQALIPHEPGLAYSITDGSRYGTMLEEWTNLMAHMPNGLSGEEQPLFDALRQLIPSAKELEGAFGVTTSVSRVSPQGISNREVTELPAP